MVEFYDYVKMDENNNRKQNPSFDYQMATFIKFMGRELVNGR